MFQRGLTLGLSGKIDEGQTQIETLLQHDSQSPFGYYAKGLLMEEKGQVDEAIKAYQKAVEITPDFIPAYLHLCPLLIQNNRTPEAVTYLKTILDYFPENEALLNLLKDNTNYPGD